MVLQKNNILRQIELAKANGKKMLAVLLDPDKLEPENIQQKIKSLSDFKIDFFLVGGSLLLTDYLDNFIRTLKENTNLPIILFPGSAQQVNKYADAILFLQLISGRNPDFLIAQQVQAAPLIKQTDLEVMPTGYILVESGRETTASYISNTKPIPADKPEIAATTALAGQYLGHRLIYLDGGSGALNPVPENMIKACKKELDIPIIVGGGIRSNEQMQATFNAGADVIVIGTAFEENSFHVD